LPRCWSPSAGRSDHSHAAAPAAAARERGFNQALELARPVGKALAHPDRRCGAAGASGIRPPKPSCPGANALQNVRGAFHCTTDFTGKRLLLIDDVMTTGASLDELARTLKLHGAAQVTVLALARALPPDQEA
jgi:predicted amidophosphoribosyltransferase